MKKIISLSLVIIAITVLSINVRAQSTTFTYQGNLLNTSIPANGNFAGQFSLYAADSGGSPIATVFPTITAVNGIFTVQLDFGPAAFDGSDRYLDITINAQPLTPRQKIASTPYAIRAERSTVSDNVSGVVAIANGGTGSATKTFVDTTTDQTVGGNKTFTGTLSGNGSGLTNLNTLTNNVIATQDATSITGNVTILTAVCPPTHPQVTGGGFLLPDNLVGTADVYMSRPSADLHGWGVRLRNNSGTTFNVTAFAMCSK